MIFFNPCDIIGPSTSKTSRYTSLMSVIRTPRLLNSANSKRHWWPPCVDSVWWRRRAASPGTSSCRLRGSTNDWMPFQKKPRRRRVSRVPPLPCPGSNERNMQPFYGSFKRWEDIPTYPPTSLPTYLQPPTIQRHPSALVFYNHFMYYCCWLKCVSVILKFAHFQFIPCCSCGVMALVKVMDNSRIWIRSGL